MSGPEQAAHLAILDELVGEVLPDVNVLGALPSTDDVDFPLDARLVVLVHWCRSLLGEPSWSRSLRRYSTSLPAVDAE